MASVMSRFHMRLITAALSPLILMVGCTSTAQIEVTSSPEEAKVKVRQSGEEAKTLQTPGNVTVNKNKDIKFIFNKKGYKEKTKTIKSGYNFYPWIALGAMLVLLPFASSSPALGLVGTGFGILGLASVFSGSGRISQSQVGAVLEKKESTESAGGIE